MVIKILKILFYNFYADLLLLGNRLLSYAVWNGFYGYSLYFAVALSVIALVLTVLIIVKNQKVGICELYSLYASFLSAICPFRYFIFLYYVDAYPILAVAYDALVFIASILSFMKLLHYIKNRKLDEPLSLRRTDKTDTQKIS